MSLPSRGENEAGEFKVGDLPSALELVLDPAFLDWGTSCNLNPSLSLTETEPESSVRGLGRSLPDTGETSVEPETGVLLPDVGPFFAPATACDSICGLAFA
jgi:hypothetical protein